MTPITERAGVALGIAYAPAGRVRIRAGTQNNYSGAGADGHADALVAAPNGGYLRIAADQRWLQTVIRFRAWRRAKRRLGASGNRQITGSVTRR